ncbi:MAG: FtsW/RodA/SpoVE family cell cycle protein [Clostridiaceae bacterium]|jgi:cell division protein FtsW|nr:FtsW/RodA/SpoVE family cell cycle protein [Clostridiaceae bacterium]
MRQKKFFQPDEIRNRDVTRVQADRLRIEPPRQIHAGLLIVTLILICFGLVMLFSASMTFGYSSEGDALYFVLKQSGITLIGLVLALFVALIIPVTLFDHFWLSLILYSVTTGLLVLVKINGLVINSARRWISLGGTTFQPSELAKISIVFCFAGYVSMISRKRKAKRLRFKTPVRQFIADGWVDVLIPGFAILIWIGLIAWQPHLSGALILCFIAAVLYLTAGISLRSWVSAIVQLLVVVLILGLIIAVLLSVTPSGELKQILQEKVVDNFEHVSKRMNSFLEPEEATDDDMYQINQAIIAMGSGGLNGIGLGEGRQKYNYLPEAHNDYVFAIIGEELGFAGTVMVVLLFFLFMYMGVGVTRKASSQFTALLAGGYTMLISIQAFLNFGVATHTLPSTGVSLPFFSYGGTSNLFFLMAIGLLLAVSRSGQRRPVESSQANRLTQPVNRPVKQSAQQTDTHNRQIYQAPIRVSGREG